MRVLVTGIEGFVGCFLAEHLLTQGNIEVHGTVLGDECRIRHLSDRITLYRGDLREAAWTEKVVREVRPELTFHLAAWSDVGTSWQKPWAVYECNIHCQLNLLEALRSEAANCRTLVVSSSEIYGAAGPEELPIREDAPLRPTNPYGVSKVAQDLMALQYWTSRRLPTIRARSFPHIGPGQSEFFVISAFAKQIAEIEQGLHEPVIRVGNLDVQRDFTDVRDVVRAYWLLATQGTPGECYNVGSGRSRSIRGLLESLLELSTITIDVQVDASRIRPNDLPVSCCNNAKLRETIGWQPEIDLQRTLADILDYWRRAGKGQAG